MAQTLIKGLEGEAGGRYRILAVKPNEGRKSTPC